MSPTIFNMVVDAVIHNWATVVSGEYTVPEGFRTVVQTLSTLFCVDDRLLTSPRLIRLQEAPDFLMGLFDRVGLRTNLKKMVGMTCQLCRTEVRKSTESYSICMMG